jgi:transposase
MIIEKLLSEPALSLQAVAEALIVNRETVTKCLQLFNQGGLDLLKPKKAGRKEGNPKYEKRIFVDLADALSRSEEPWSVYRMQAFIEKNHGVTVPESTIYYRMAKMGYARRAKDQKRLKSA